MSAQFNTVAAQTGLAIAAALAFQVPFTYGQWFKRTEAISHTGTLFARKSGTYDPELFHSAVSGGMKVVSTTTGGSQVLAGGAIPLNEWHHYAITYDGGTSFKYYIDGVLTDTKTVGETATGTQDIVFCGEAVNALGIQGKATHVFFATIEYSAAQILAQKNSATLALTTGIFYFCTMMNSTTNDESGSGHNPTATGTIVFDSDTPTFPAVGGGDPTDISFGISPKYAA